jgi:hypothetical protein
VSSFPSRGRSSKTWFNDPDASELKEAKAKSELVEALPEDIRRAFRYMEIFEKMKHGEAMLMLPFELNIK